MAKRDGEEAEYPIAAVSKLTGVSCHALRVWERRYGFPVPHRSPSGHRRYSHRQVVTLLRLSELSRTGRPIGELIAEVRAGRLALDVVPDRGAARADDVAIGEFLDKMMAGDLAGGHAAFRRLEERFAGDDLVTRVITPALIEAGERWFRRAGTIYQARCVSGFLHHKLHVLIEAAGRENPRPSRTVLVGAVQGDRHEGGVLIAHLLLERAGWRVINLGVDLPVSEFARAVAQFRPDALAVSLALSRNINKRFQELSKIRGVPVFVGGRSILNYQNLARRFGLIPVPGPATEAVGLLLQGFDAWAQRHSAMAGEER
jgi:DNA-binding transcriptional MerR regulator/methanogenic corrinoid protein MtbC1